MKIDPPILLHTSTSFTIYIWDRGDRFLVPFSLGQLKEKPPLLEQRIATMITAKTMVAGTDFFFIPKYKGIKPTPEKATALVKNLMTDWPASSGIIVSGSCIKRNERP
jgi:hypothetical protein